MIESSETLPVPPVRLPRLADLTIRAGAGYRPTLILAADAAIDDNAFLFRLADGKLTLEGLDFLLQPGKLEIRSLAAVAAAGDGECSFKDCVLTLEAGFTSVSLATVGLARGLRGDRPLDQRLRLSFSNCLVRGQGDLLAGAPGRSFDLQADNVLAALTGSFLRLTGTADDAMTAPVEVQLHRITTYLGGHLLNLIADPKTQALPPVHVRPVDDCLFIAADNKVLIRLDGVDVNGERMTDQLVWQGNHNAYNRFMDMLEKMPSDKMMGGMRVPTNKEVWFQQYAHGEVEFNIKLSDLPNQMLARRVPAGQPRAVQGVPHRPGQITLRRPDRVPAQAPSRPEITKPAQPPARDSPNPSLAVGVVALISLLLGRLFLLLACLAGDRLLGLGGFLFAHENGVIALGKVLVFGQSDANNAHEFTSIMVLIQPFPPRPCWVFS